MKRAILVGNPNTGKTTLFNTLTFSNEHVGNWHGVTVEEKGKRYKHKGEEIYLVDLPGIYSTSPLSYEEEVACNYLKGHKEDIVVNICEESNLHRNLYLTLCLLEMGLKVVLVVNRIDKRPIWRVDYSVLSKSLGIDILVVRADKKEECNAVSDKILEGTNGCKPLPYFKDLDLSNFEDACQHRYAFIDELISRVTSKRERVQGKSKLDKVFLNKFLAVPIFLLVILAVFYLTFFSVGKWLSKGLNFLLDVCFSSPIHSLLLRWFGDSSWITALFDNAIVGGAGYILTFLPQVALLFLFLSILEDSGYLSRIAFLFDDILSKVGLSGKSVYTLLMGFGCSTSAVLTARNMEDKNSKIKTALLTPYMSCSAKFPIYSVIGGAFFGANNIWVILGLYLLGVILAVTISFVLEKTVLKSKQQSFILEFPPYRMASFKRTMNVLWQNVKLFLSRVGTLIFAMNIVVWVLANFSFTFKFVGNGGESILEGLGRLISPIFRPLGFGSWVLVSALLAGIIAKEVIVSSIVLFNGCAEGDTLSLQSSLLSFGAVASFTSGASVISYLVFCLLYVPCLATISVMSKEIGAKWTAIGMIIEFVVAYLASFVVYNFASAIEIFGFARVLIFVATLWIIFLSIYFLIKRIKNKKNCSCSFCDKNCQKK